MHLEICASGWLRLICVFFVIYGVTCIDEQSPDIEKPIQYELINRRRSPRAVVVNALRTVRHRRNVNPPTDYVNDTATTNSSTKYSTVGVADVTSSSRDVTSTVSLQSDITSTSSVLTSTQNTPSLNVETDVHAYYYTYKYIRDEDEAMSYWVEHDRHSTVLDNDYRKAITVGLNFTFLFYGHEVNSITITTAGFVYMSEFLHSMMAFSQYIAPLMADFTTAHSNDSFVRYFGNGTAFVVSWHNTLIEGQKTEPFVFQLILYNTSDIVFVYKSMPIPISNISTDNHKVVVGLSDAYYYDEYIGSGYISRTISEYSRISINTDELVSRTAVAIKPLPTCVIQKSCEECLQAAPEIHFDCQWCSEVKRCSDGYDRHRQHWLHNECHSTQISSEKNCPVSVGQGTNSSEYDGSLVGLLVLLFVIALLMITACVVFVVFAVRHPNSSTGQCLIRNRPSVLFQRLTRCICCYRAPDSTESQQTYVTFHPDACGY